VNCRAFLQISIIVLFYCGTACLSAEDLFGDKNIGDLFTKDVYADLKEPTYTDGVLTTTQGGVVTGPNMRIQARQITYTRKVIEGQPRFTIEAEGDLMLEFNDYVFIGKRLEYDFQTKTGSISHGRSSVEPWFFGGERILLLADGSYLIEHGFVTTSESDNVDWKIASEESVIYPNKDFKAKEVKFRFFDTPLFWLPSLNVNLDYIFDAPIRYSARWGGKQGPRAELIYEIFSWERWKTFLRFDYRLTRGPGLGFETYYRSVDHLVDFESINYIARDSSLDDPNEKVRFRFQGEYNQKLVDEKVDIHLVYDKLSDREMATDYSDSGLDLEYTGLTRLQVRRQDENWISNFVTSVRLNGFQTAKQELPTYEVSYRAFNDPTYGLISENNIELSYLDYKYANNLTDGHDYRSARLAYQQQVYRPFHIRGVNLTPELGSVAIYYSNLRKEHRENNRWVLVGIAACEANLPFWKVYPGYKHVITPFVRYQYFTFPRSTPHDHYIFDIDDGWYRVNHMAFGVSQSFYIKQRSGIIERPILWELYADAFFDTRTLTQSIQKVHSLFVYNSTPFLRHTLGTAWDVAHQQLGYFNLRTEWTYSENFAVAAEFRYRNPYDWRKADHTNFVLDSFVSVRELLDSSLSDRRDTILLHLFYRLHPNWALQFMSRHGWNRRHEPPYNELEVDLIGTLQSAWHVTLSYQHRENDHHRFTLGFNVGLSRPDQSKCENIVPVANF
jgi:hypothetical protein